MTVVPVTSNVERIYPFHVLLPSGVTGLRRNSKARAEQVRSVAVQGVGDPIGRRPAALMDQLDHGLRLHLAL